MPITLVCEWCGKEFSATPQRLKNKHHCCSKRCMALFNQNVRNNTDGYLNCTCSICGKKFHIKKYHLDRYNTHTCSKDCTKTMQRLRMVGSKNHQYGIRGEDNASFCGGRRLSNYGYWLIYSPTHPFCNSDGYVFEHRLVAEKYLLTDDNSVIIDGVRYLKPEYIVHHKDENRKNNDVSNLEVMLKGIHSSYHAKLYYERRKSEQCSIETR